MVINKFNYNYQNLNMPDTCPVCGGDLKIYENGRVYCINDNCNQKIVHRIANFFTVLDIKGAGPAYFENVAKDVNTLAAFLRKITQEKDNETSIKWAGGINGNKVSDNIRKVLSKPITVSKYLALFDFEGFGEKKLKQFEESKAFKSLANKEPQFVFNIIENNKYFDNSVDGMSTEQRVILYENIVKHKEDIVNCFEFFSFETEKPQINTDGKLTGMSFCFTGAACKPRKELEKMVADNGGVVSAVKKGLSYLVTDDTESGSAKNKKAKELNIPVITSQEFLNLLGA